MTPDVRRKEPKRILMAALLVSAVAMTANFSAPSGAVAPATTMAMPMDSGDGLLPPGDWTAAQRTYLEDLIDRTERDLPAFADPATLESMGFHDFGIAAPGGYVHYINNAWIDDDHILDPTHPESLLFQQVWDPDTGTEHLELKAAMFFMPTGTTMDTIPEDLAWIPGWHVHPDVCVTDDVTFAGLANSDGTCSFGHPQIGPPMTHVWIEDNACDHRFAMVDVGGLMCDMHMHEPDAPHPDDHEHPGATTSTTPPTTVVSPVAVAVRRAPVARAVGGQPAYTG